MVEYDTEYRVSSKKDLEVIIEHFKKYPAPASSFFGEHAKPHPLRGEAGENTKIS